MKILLVLSILATSALGVQASSSPTSSTAPNVFSLTASNSQTTSFSRCSYAASTSMTRCVSAIQAVQIDDTSNDSYSQNLDECWCSSISNMIECYPDTSTSTLSRLLSNWATRGCDSLITGTVPGATGTSEPTNETGRSTTQNMAEETTSTGDEGGGSSAMGNALPGWWIMLVVTVVGVATGGFAVWL